MRSVKNDSIYSIFERDINIMKATLDGRKIRNIL